MDSNNLLPFREKEAKQERLKIESEELLPACESVLWTTFLFDGFGYSDKQENRSNIAKLYNAFYEDISKSQRRYYYPGLGAAFEPEEVAVRSAVAQKASDKAAGELASSTKDMVARQGKGIAEEAWQASQGNLAKFPQELIKEGAAYADFIATRDIKQLANAGWYELKNRWHTFQNAVLKHPWRVGKEASTFVSKMTAGTVAESLGFLRDHEGLAMLFNTGVETRLKAAEKDFKEAVETASKITHVKKINIALFGYDMGGGLALGFANQLLKGICAGGYYEGIPVSIKFMGLFDCVTQRFDPNTLLGYIPFAAEVTPDMYLHPKVETCVHYAAAHEQRFYKPLSMLGVDPQRHDGPRQERLFPGSQEDVGGGGSEEHADELSRYPLNMMYHRAYGAGIPMPSLQRLGEIDPDLHFQVKSSVVAKRFQLEYRKALHQIVEQVRTIPPLFVGESNIVRAMQGYEQDCEKPKAPITVKELPSNIAKEAGGHMAIYIEWLRMWFDEHKDDIQENTKWYSPKWDVSKADKRRYDLLLKDISNVEKNLPNTPSDYNQAVALERLGGAMAPSMFNHDPQAQALWWLWSNPGKNTELAAALYAGFKEYMHDSLIESDIDVLANSFIGAKSYLNIREMVTLDSRPNLGFWDYVKLGFEELFL